MLGIKRDPARADALAREADDVLRPILTRAKDAVPDQFWTAYQAGMISSMELFRAVLDEMDPVNGTRPRVKKNS